MHLRQFGNGGQCRERANAADDRFGAVRQRPDRHAGLLEGRREVVAFAAHQHFLLVRCERLGEARLGRHARHAEARRSRLNDQLGQEPQARIDLERGGRRDPGTNRSHAALGHCGDELAELSADVFGLDDAAQSFQGMPGLRGNTALRFANELLAFADQAVGLFRHRAA